MFSMFSTNSWQLWPAVSMLQGTYSRYRITEYFQRCLSLRRVVSQRSLTKNLELDIPQFKKTMTKISRGTYRLEGKIRVALGDCSISFNKQISQHLSRPYIKNWKLYFLCLSLGPALQTCSTRQAAQQDSCLPQRQYCHSSYICLIFYIHTLGNYYFWIAKYYLKDRHIIYHAFWSARLLWFHPARAKFTSLGYLKISTTTKSGHQGSSLSFNHSSAFVNTSPFFFWNSFWKEECSSAHEPKYPDTPYSEISSNHRAGPTPWVVTDLATAVL